MALGEACEVAADLLHGEGKRERWLRDRLHGTLAEKLDEVSLNGYPDERLPNTPNLRFAGLIGSDLLDKVPELAFSRVLRATRAALLRPRCSCTWDCPRTLRRAPSG